MKILLSGTKKFSEFLKVFRRRGPAGFERVECADGDASTLAEAVLEWVKPEDGVRDELPHSIAVTVEEIEAALKKFDWNQTQAARYLDLSRKTLIYRMEKHGIRGERQDAENG